MWLPQRCKWTPLIQRLLWAGHFHGIPSLDPPLFPVRPSHSRAVPLLTMSKAQDYCNQKPKCVPIKKIWLIAINSMFLWINIMHLVPEHFGLFAEANSDTWIYFPCCSTDHLILLTSFHRGKGIFSVSQSAPSKVLATHLHVDLWVTKCTPSYWCQGSPVTALGFHQPLIWNKFISKSCPTISQEWCHSTGVNDQDFSPLL